MTHSQALVSDLMTELEGIRHGALDATETLRARLKGDPVIQNGVRHRMLALAELHERAATQCQQLLAVVHREYQEGR
jgi:hypothetical protein